MKTPKTIVLVTLAFITVSNYSNAQMNDDDDEERPRIGLKTGFNFSNVYDSEGENFEADGKLGMAVGAFLSLPFGKLIGFQPEVLLSQRGFTANGTFFGMPYEMNRRTTHLDIPLLLSFRPAPFFSILVGPQYSYLLNQKDSYSGTTVGFNVENEFDNDNIRKNTLSITGGADINMGHFVLSSRVGFDLLKNRGDGTSNTPRYKNAWVQLTAGYRF